MLSKTVDYIYVKSLAMMNFFFFLFLFFPIKLTLNNAVTVSSSSNLFMKYGPNNDHNLNSDKSSSLK